MIKGVHHLSIATTDLDRTLAFYCELLGLPVGSTLQVENSRPFSMIVGLPGARVHGAWRRAANMHVEIFQYLEPALQAAEPRPACEVGIRHICFDVTDIRRVPPPAGRRGRVLLRTAAPEERGLVGLRRTAAGNIVELQEILPESPGVRAILPV